MEDLVNPSPAFWRGRKVLLTGHTGFKGSWLALWLKRLGAEVTGYALPPPTEPNLFALSAGAGVDHDVKGDLRDLDALAACVAEYRPEVVFHMGAQALVRRAYRDPVETFATNVMGTVNLLEVIRRTTEVRAVVNVTSDKCYENKEWYWAYREDEPMGGHDPYSASKGCAELVTSAWRRSYFSGNASPTLASVRAGNVIGGGDWAEDRILPDCIRALSTGQSIEVRNPQAVRPWQHVLEPLSGYLLVAEGLCGRNGMAAQAWNFGPADEEAQPVSVVVDNVVRLWGPGAKWHTRSSGELREATFLKVDSSKARALLGWKPRMRLGTALSWTVDWYRRNSAGEGARDLCMEQIERYEGWNSLQ